MNHSEVECKGSPILSRDELREYVRAEIEEIMRYKWCLGVALGHDPLLDMSMDEIAMEWISRYAAAFSQWWKERSGKRVVES